VLNPFQTCTGPEIEAIEPNDALPNSDNLLPSCTDDNMLQSEPVTLWPETDKSDPSRAAEAEDAMPATCKLHATEAEEPMRFMFRTDKLLPTFDRPPIEESPNDRRLPVTENESPTCARPDADNLDPVVVGPETDSGELMTAEDPDTEAPHDPVIGPRTDKAPAIRTSCATERPPPLTATSPADMYKDEPAQSDDLSDRAPSTRVDEYNTDDPVTCTASRVDKPEESIPPRAESELPDTIFVLTERLDVK
jgi:hypothetical protein